MFPSVPILHELTARKKYGLYGAMHIFMLLMNFNNDGWFLEAQAINTEIRINENFKYCIPVIY
jgi:hypothetical protein